MDLADSELEISTESVLHRIRRKGFFLSLINVHRMRYRLHSDESLSPFSVDKLEEKQKIT